MFYLLRLAIKLKVKFLDTFLSNFNNREHLVLSAMTGSAFAMTNMTYLLSLDLESTFKNNFVIILLLFIIILYISIGIRLLHNSQNVIYNYNFINEIVINNFKNIKIILRQIKNNITQ